jgi:N6-adenosine-specific RNA methylase IME4
MAAADLSVLADEARWHEAQAAGDSDTALEHYAEAGARLTRVKKVVGHGGWLGWLAGEPWLSVRYAQYLMEWAALVSANTQCIAYLPRGTGLIAAIQSVRGGSGGASGVDDSAEPPPFGLPRRDYRIVLADPPWRYESWTGKSKNTRRRRVVEDKYPTLSVEQIMALPVADVSAADALLLCWVTLPLLREGLEVVAAWGFKYRTAFLVWGKVNENYRPVGGFGRYTRSNGELCLLGRRGAGVKPVEGVAIANLVLSKRGRHSEKPVAQYDIIDRLFGRDIPRVELFARRRMPGWDVWGLEAPEGVSALDLEVAG